MISSISFIFGNLCFYHMHHTTMDFAQVLTFVLKKKKHLKKRRARVKWFRFAPSRSLQQ